MPEKLEQLRLSTMLLGGAALAAFVASMFLLSEGPELAIGIFVLLVIVVFLAMLPSSKEQDDL